MLTRLVRPLRSIALAPLLSGCMTTPADSSIVTSPTDPVDFTGYALTANATIQLRAADASGTYRTFASAAIATTSEQLPGGQSFYPWELRTTVPREYWTRVPGCSHEAATVEGRQVSRTGNYTLYTFDPSTWTCLSTEFAFGATTSDATARCAHLAPIRLVYGASATHTGDLVIRSQREADAYRCVEVIHGSLQITGTELRTALPNLRRVTGDLSITSQYITSPSGGPALAVIALDQLTSVGGSLTLRFDSMSSPGDTYVDFGLPRLGRVSRDVTIELRNFNTHPSGLPRLSRIDGNLRIGTVAGSDLSAPHLLERLRLVSGSVLLELGHNIGSVLPALERVERDVSIGPNATSHPYISPAVLPLLRHVVGNFTVAGSTLYAGTFPALNTVDGTFSLLRLGDSRPLGSSALTLHRLVIADTALQSFPLAPAPATTLRPSAPVTIRNNPSLCSSAITAFLSSQSGWTGASTLSGNRDGC